MIFRERELLKAYKRGELGDLEATLFQTKLKMKEFDRFIKRKVARYLQEKGYDVDWLITKQRFEEQIERLEEERQERKIQQLLNNFSSTKRRRRRRKRRKR